MAFDAHEAALYAYERCDHGERFCSDCCALAIRRAYDAGVEDAAAIAEESEKHWRRYLSDIPRDDVRGLADGAMEVKDRIRALVQTKGEG